MSSKEALWRELVLAIESCRACELHRHRTKVVVGEGSLYSDLMFIGEAPGQKEDEEGRPFVGAAGKVLTELLESRGIKREHVFITNVVKCRPPGNREPRDEEIKACSTHTLSIIRIISPKLIVTLGNHAGKFLLELYGGVKWLGVSRMRGKVYSVRLDFEVVQVFPTYHPATALYNPGVRSVLEEDFNVIKDELIKLRSPTRRKSVTLLDFMRG